MDQFDETDEVNSYPPLVGVRVQRAYAAQQRQQMNEYSRSVYQQAIAMEGESEMDAQTVAVARNNLLALNSEADEETRTGEQTDEVFQLLAKSMMTAIMKWRSTGTPQGPKWAALREKLTPRQIAIITANLQLHCLLNPTDKTGQNAEKGGERLPQQTRRGSLNGGDDVVRSDDVLKLLSSTGSRYPNESGVAVALAAKYFEEGRGAKCHSVLLKHSQGCQNQQTTDSGRVSASSTTAQVDVEALKALIAINLATKEFRQALMNFQKLPEELRFDADIRSEFVSYLPTPKGNKQSRKEVSKEVEAKKEKVTKSRGGLWGLLRRGAGEEEAEEAVGGDGKSVVCVNPIKLLREGVEFWDNKIKQGASSISSHNSPHEAKCILLYSLAQRCYQQGEYAEAKDTFRSLIDLTRQEGRGTGDPRAVIGLVRAISRLKMSEEKGESGGVTEGRTSAASGSSPAEMLKMINNLMPSSARLIDPEDVEVGSLPAQPPRSRQLAVNPGAGQPKQGGVVSEVKKKHKRRKSRYPKGYTGASLSGRPDPERWLPRHERSSTKKSKSRRSAAVSARGPQGSVPAEGDVEMSEASNRATTSNTAAATDTSSRRRKGRKGRK
eukprot:GHVN01056368.1.p1 GENE.GHVN01056368.1~~GHVN01056368.1.p1  ORF type:complete len:677 (+),score=184.77 GHVN01056368.1:206-2032(+)